MGAVVEAVLGAVTRYGHVALFALVASQTAWIVHFAPGEVVIPAAAASLLSGRRSPSRQGSPGWTG
jgi:hypothetical protein